MAYASTCGCIMAHILDLPNEILIKVASLLNLDDLKSLSLACQRLSEIAISYVMVKKSVLWLNRVDEIPAQFGNKISSKRYIPVETLKTSRRSYYAIGIVLPVILSKYELTMIQLRLNALLLEKAAVRDLHITDSHSLQMVTLWEHFPILFQTLDSITVTVHESHIRKHAEVVWELPNLRRITWNELSYNSAMRRDQRICINLYAPKLQEAIFVTPKDLYMHNNNFSSMLVVKTVGNLRELKCVVGYQVIDMLSNNRLPALQRLSMFTWAEKNDVIWDIIASNTPELQFLEVKRDPTMPSADMAFCPFLVYCSMLTELHLESMNVTDIFDKSYLWHGIKTLHLHDCLVYPKANKTPVTLSSVTTLCISLYFVQDGRLVLNLPSVETLSISKASEELDILEMPKLKTLHMRIRFNHQFTFMRDRMPDLRDVILDTPVSFLPGTEQAYHMMLNPANKLINLTVVCRSGRAINNLLANVNREQPALKTLNIIGSGVMSKINKNTFRTLLKLVHLESLLITNVQVSGSLPHPIPLPPQLHQLRIRSLCLPMKSRFITMRRTQRRLGTIAERRVLHHKFFAVNSFQIPQYFDIQGGIEVCLDQLIDMYFSP
ncbi:uncharacterized protein LOC128306612 [Anopheles moucheti]|uniref:uncharacterized protein LOC128306612 n=1 Tax=Anopheles moucheti TaxID=186751 RepID=UPI0022F103AF|nr:uncharacterized protein LOC128306612 [Anopheles moucheti]